MVFGAKPSSLCRPITRDNQRQLHKEALQWRQAMALRHYITAVETAGLGASQTASLLAFQEWLARARSYADTIDPIARSQAAAVPPYPEPATYDRISCVFLDYDDPAEADQVLQKEPWRR